eukprot:118695-Hanusia_phi.AAC.4
MSYQPSAGTEGRRKCVITLSCSKYNNRGRTIRIKGKYTNIRLEIKLKNTRSPMIQYQSNILTAACASGVKSDSGWSSRRIPFKKGIGMRLDGASQEVMRIAMRREGDMYGEWGGEGGEGDQSGHAARQWRRRKKRAGEPPPHPTRPI